MASSDGLAKGLTAPMKLFVHFQDSKDEIAEVSLQSLGQDVQNLLLKFQTGKTSARTVAHALIVALFKRDVTSKCTLSGPQSTECTRLPLKPVAPFAAKLKGHVNSFVLAGNAKALEECVKSFFCCSTSYAGAHDSRTTACVKGTVCFPFADTVFVDGYHYHCPVT